MVKVVAMLIIRSLAGLIFLLSAMAVPLYFAGDGAGYWQAWTFLAVFGVCTLLITLYLMAKDPALLERRVQAGPVAEKRVSQQIIQSITTIGFFAIFIVSALDHRLGWTNPPEWAVPLGNALVALGLIIIFFVFRENTFTSGTIEVAQDQYVVTTGPYALIRHPMYFGALVMFAGVPLALDSFAGLLAIIPLKLGIMARAIDEERFLAAELPGYDAYRARVRARLMPLVW